MGTVTVDCILARMPFKRSIEIFGGKIEGLHCSIKSMMLKYGNEGQYY